VAGLCVWFLSVGRCTWCNISDLNQTHKQTTSHWCGIKYTLPQKGIKHTNQLQVTDVVSSTHYHRKESNQLQVTLIPHQWFVAGLIPFYGKVYLIPHQWLVAGLIPFCGKVYLIPHQWLVAGLCASTPYHRKESNTNQLQVTDVTSSTPYHRKESNTQTSHKSLMLHQVHVRCTWCNISDL
jgi:hypothetical protein